MNCPTSFSSTPGPAGDAPPAGAVEQLGLLPLPLAHRVVDGPHPAHLPLDLPLVHVHLPGHLAHARDHPHHLAHRPELLHLPHLGHEVVERERALLELGLLGGDLVLVELRHRVLDEAQDVAHAQDPLGHALGRNSSSASSRSPTPMNFTGLPVIILDDSSAPPRVSESNFVRISPSISSCSLNALALLTGVLAAHGVEHEEHLVGLELGVDLLQLAHQRVVDVQPAGGVEDDDVAAGGLRLLHRRPGRPRPPRPRHLAVRARPSCRPCRPARPPARRYAELLDRRRGAAGRRGEHRVMPLCPRGSVPSLPHGRRLTGALQAAIMMTVGGGWTV
jgi:hypothetical protein